MRKQRIASLDYGIKRIGVALSDENQMIASGLGVIEAGKNKRETVYKILSILKPYDLEKVIVGLPLHLDGREGVLAHEVKQFIASLEQEVPYPIIPYDERFSTLQAERSLKDAGMNRKKRVKYVDMLSAVILLQNYLN